MSTSQTAPAPLVSILASEPRRWFLGSQAWIRVGTQQSGGSLAIAEHLIPPAAESPWHVHHTQDESFYVLDGQVTVIIGQQRFTLGPGDYAFGPREVPHGFRVEGQSPARLLLICTPGAGFDRFIHQGSEPATTAGFPPPSLPTSPGWLGWPPKPAASSWVPCPRTCCEDTIPHGTGQPMASGSLGGQARRSHQEGLTSSTSDRP